MSPIIDEGGGEATYSGPNGYQLKIFEQSATFIAQLQSSDDSETLKKTFEKWWISRQWWISGTYLPIIVGAALGVLILLVTTFALALWRCCRQSKYTTQTAEKCKSIGRVEGTATGVSTVSVTSSAAPTDDTTDITNGSIPLPPPLPPPVLSITMMQAAPKGILVGRRESGDMTKIGHGCYVGFHLPDVPESHQSTMTSTSSTVLNTVGHDKSLLWYDRQLQTRSLPGWVRKKSLRQDISTSTAAPSHDHCKDHFQNQLPQQDLAALAVPTDKVQRQERLFLVDNKSAVRDERTAF